MNNKISKSSAKLMTIVLLGIIVFSHSEYIATNADNVTKTYMVNSSSKKTLSDEEIDKKIAEIISGMSIEQKLAQMMIVSLRSDADNVHTTKLTKAYKNLLKYYDFGGVILFGKSIIDTEQTITLIRDCQSSAMKSAAGVPMFVCIDQEGGYVNRIPFATLGSGNMALGAAGDTALTEEIAEILGQEIRALGFNMNFAPVSDVNNNPANPVIGIRSFSDDPQITGEHVTAFINGLHNSSISSALKHFPGHGNVGKDSHTHLPLSKLTKSELKKCELIPFTEGIKAGTDMIMTAHIQYPNIEKNTYISKKDGKKVYLPATLSHTIITDILRNDLGYDGIIITDSMTMDAIESHFDETDATVMAINAGIDIILDSIEIYRDDDVNTFPKVKKYMQKLTARVKKGDIKEEELDDSVARILKLKYKNGIMTDTLSVSKKKQIKIAKKTIGSAQNREKDWEIASKGITLLKNNDSMLPINGKDGKNTLILIPDDSKQDTVDYSLERLEKERLIDTSKVNILSYNGLTIEDKELLKGIRKADRVLILSQTTKKNDLICSIIKKAHQKKGCPVALLSMNLPYEVAYYEEADAVICAYNAYGSTFDSQKKGPFALNVAAALCAIFGEYSPTGTLPVNIPKIKESTNVTTTYSDELLYKRGFSFNPVSVK